MSLAEPARTIVQQARPNVPDNNTLLSCPLNHAHQQHKTTNLRNAMRQK
ncbi:MAG: hypothetical protein V3R25_06260 [Nitrosomonadaceae bacterium]